MNSRLQYLLEQWSNGRFTETEKLELFEMLQSASAEQEIVPVLHDIWEKLEDEGQFTDEQQQVMIRNILDRYPGGELPDEKEIIPTTAPVHRIRFMRRWALGVASSVALVLSIGAYYWYQNKLKTPPAGTIHLSENVQPGKNGALLTLSNGSQVLLDTIQNGKVALQGGVVARVRNGVLFYEGTGSEVLYNTISTPKGRQFQLKLSDGTSVWLNAESSIRYPVVFTRDERLIRIAGEVYMEVAPQASAPFRVDVNGRTWIEVLGTSFNVNAYENEGAIRTTLLEGSVRVGPDRSGKGPHKLLSPGQQALTARENEPVQVINAANAASVIAWKEGVFDFDNIPLEEAMRQLARWYDIEIVYQQPVPEVQLGGTIKRSLPFTDVLYFLGSVGLHYRLEGTKKLIILP